VKINHRANKFEVETWTDGFPMWVTIRHDGVDIVRGVHHSEIKDLEFCLDRMKAALRAALGKDAHQLD
jgi:hypothetical protein